MGFTRQTMYRQVKLDDSYYTPMLVSAVFGSLLVVLVVLVVAHITYK